MSDLMQPAPKLPNAWSGDRRLQEALRWRLDEDVFARAEAELQEVGGWATAPDTLSKALQAERETPEHVPYSTWGQRIDEIKVSPAYYALGRAGVAAGVTAMPYEDSAYGADARIVWGALVAMWGPSSALYSCPVAMTDAAARTLLTHGDSDDLEVIERLTTRDPARAWTSGQWMTEMAGGSDVSRTGTVARRGADGKWRLSGTKWFTSATTSEMALTLARPEGAPDGSKGLSLFRIHRQLEDGTRNSIVVRRLKDKLGTRSMPTAELELNEAIAVPVGDPLDFSGVRRISTMLNLTRIHNTIGSASALGRGFAVARSYAQVRQVFGRMLIDMPAHRATLFDLAVDHSAALALALTCCRLAGKAEHGSATEAEVALLRGLTPVAKLSTARWAVAGVAEAMEAVGGVGYCEDSGIPALVRNTHVMPIWEGTTNVLSLDLLRAQYRSGAATAILEAARELVGGLTEHGYVSESARSVLDASDAIEQRFGSLTDETEAQTVARSLAMGCGSTYACAVLTAQGAWAADQGDGSTAAEAARLADRGLVPASVEGLDRWDPLDSPERADL